MTNEEWLKVEDRLKFFYDIVKLKCDSFEISLVLERMGQYKNAIVIYINGQIRGQWLTECEESRRFYQKRSKQLYNKKKVESGKKLSKKEIAYLKKMGVDFDKKYNYYSPYWKSFNSLKKQLIKENTNIELIS